MAKSRQGIEPRWGSGVEVEEGASEIALFVVFVAPVGQGAGNHQKCFGFLHGAGDVPLGANGKGGEVANRDFDGDSADA